MLYGTKPSHDPFYVADLRDLLEFGKYCAEIGHRRVEDINIVNLLEDGVKISGADSVMAAWTPTVALRGVVLICGRCVFSGVSFSLATFIVFGAVSYALGAGLGGFAFGCGLSVRGHVDPSGEVG